MQLNNPYRENAWEEEEGNWGGLEKPRVPEGRGRH